MKQVDLDWEWFDQSARAIAQRCRARFGDGDGDFKEALDGIVVLGRGGMPLGTRLSHLLGVPVVGSVIMSRYKDPVGPMAELGAPVDGVVVSPHALRRRGHLLLVDNIISEGVTLNLAVAALAGAGVASERLVTCALLARGHHAEEGIVGARVPDQETWYVFPWEVRP